MDYVTKEYLKIALFLGSIVIIVIVVTLLNPIESASSRAQCTSLLVATPSGVEPFDINISKWQQANTGLVNNTEGVPRLDRDVALDHNNKTKYTPNSGESEIKHLTNKELNYKLDNTLGDVLVEWDFEDTGDLLDGGAMEGVAVHTLKCSRSCCPSQWPLPKELRDKGNMCGRDLVRSNYTCGNGSESGCVCLPRANYNMIARRGNNATWNKFD